MAVTDREVDGTERRRRRSGCCRAWRASCVECAWPAAEPGGPRSTRCRRGPPPAARPLHEQRPPAAYDARRSGTPTAQSRTSTSTSSDRRHQRHLPYPRRTSTPDAHQHQHHQHHCVRLFPKSDKPQTAKNVKFKYRGYKSLML